MGKRGRLPSSKLMGGAWVAKQQAAEAEHAKHDPKQLLAMPKGLTSGAKRRWQTLAPLLLEDRRLKPDTKDALIVFVKIADREQVLTEQLLAEGEVVQTPHGPVANPLHKVVQGLRSQMLRYQACLGLDPTSRARLESAGHLEREQNLTEADLDLLRIMGQDV